MKILRKEEQQGILPYKLVNECTIYEYYHKFDWDERILQTLYKTHTLEPQIIENTENLITELNKDIYDYLDLTRIQKKKLKQAWKTTPDNLKETTSLNDTQRTYDKSIHTLLDGPTSIGNMYAMKEILKQREENDNEQELPQ